MRDRIRTRGARPHSADVSTASFIDRGPFRFRRRLYPAVLIDLQPDAAPVALKIRPGIRIAFAVFINATRQKPVDENEPPFGAMGALLPENAENRLKCHGIASTLSGDPFYVTRLPHKRFRFAPRQPDAGATLPEIPATPLAQRRGTVGLIACFGYGLCRTCKLDKFTPISL